MARDTSAQAWAAAERLLAGIDSRHIARVQTTLAASQSTGQARMSSLHAAYRASTQSSDLEIYPNVWAGVRLLRGGAGTALVGSHQEVLLASRKPWRSQVDRPQAREVESLVAH